MESWRLNYLFKCNCKLVWGMLILDRLSLKRFGFCNWNLKEMLIYVYIGVWIGFGKYLC